MLAVLGVDLIVIVAFLGVVLSRRRWVSRQPGAFKGAAPHRSPILGIVDWRQAASRPPPSASRRWHSASGRVLPQPGQIAPGGRPGTM